MERTQADFPVACLLSGGIDSGSIACSISQKKIVVCIIFQLLQRIKIMMNQV